MKKLSSILLLLFVGFVGFSQTWTDAIEGSGGIPPLQNVNGLNNAAFESLTGNPGEWSKVMGVLGEFDDIDLVKKGILGSVMFFDKENKGKLYVNNGKVYTIDNINYNIKTNQFQSRMENDSIFIYRMDGLKRVVINNTDFSIMYNPVEKREKIYEVIEPGIKISLVKDHIIKYQKASPNPMVNRKSSKFIKKWKYYTVDHKNRIVPFKAKKKFVLNMLEDADQKKGLKEYMSKNKLSASNEKDLKAIFKYLNTL